MQASADIEFRAIEAAELIACVLRTEPKSLGDSNRVGFKLIEERVVKVLRGLPMPLTKEGAGRDLFIVGKDKLLPPTTVFLMHEV